MDLDGLSISKIEIKKTAISASFTLAPSSVNIQCGSTTAQTFTVTPSTATNYQWNLGANNGWLHNGSAAPSTISTGTANTLTLTPVCGAVQSNVSATVTAAGSTSNTNASTVTSIQPALSISGASVFCSGTSQYSVANLPCNATVSWTSSNPSVATVSSSGNPATVTKVGNGSATITATVTGGCLTNRSISTTISVGAPGPLSIQGPTQATTCEHPCFQLMGTTPSDAIQWYYPGNWQPYSTQVNSTNSCAIPAYTEYSQTYQIAAQATNACGSASIAHFITIQPCNLYYYSVSPNPATSDVRIAPKPVSEKESTAKSQAHKTITEINIYDQTGILKKHQKLGRASSATLRVNDLKAGLYIIEIIDGTYKERQKLSIER